MHPSSQRVQAVSKKHEQSFYDCEIRHRVEAEQFHQLSSTMAESLELLMLHDVAEAYPPTLR
jgi:hypothetical protein